MSSWPQFTEEESRAVSEVLMSGKVNYWTGVQAREFEKEFSEWSGAAYSIAVMNGTVALDLALKALNVGPGDEVIVTPRSFIASVSCVVNAGATPIFVDVDHDTGNLTAEKIKPLLSKRTKAFICVHLGGWPCDMDPIIELAEDCGAHVIEDCAQAHGAVYKGRSVGSLGDIGCWSFCQDKIMSTGGEGGMVTCNDKSLWEVMWSYKDHGKSFSAMNRVSPLNRYKWVHETFGTNYRMTEMQAVIGRIQLKRMTDWTGARNLNAARIQNALLPFSGVNGAVRLPQFKCIGCSTSSSCCKHANYRCYAYIRHENLSGGWTRDLIIDEINSLGVPCFVGSCSEVYLEKCFVDRSLKPAKRLRVAKELGDTSLAFLVDPSLSERAMSETADVITDVFERVTLSL